SDTTRYATPSHAPQAVLTPPVRAGLARFEGIRRPETAIWPRLAAMCRRYGTGHRKALTRDWTKAQAWLKQQRPQGVQSRTTSPEVTGGRLPTPSVHASLRRLETHLAHTEPPPQPAPPDAAATFSAHSSQRHTQTEASPSLAAAAASPSPPVSTTPRSPERWTPSAPRTNPSSARSKTLRARTPPPTNSSPPDASTPDASK